MNNLPALPKGLGLAPRYGIGVVEGFVYAADTESGPMTGAGIGDRVRIPFPGPPWIVVDHAIETVIAARWPGQLLRVASVPPADRAEREPVSCARAAPPGASAPGGSRPLVIWPRSISATRRYLAGATARLLRRAQLLPQDVQPGFERVVSQRRRISQQDLHRRHHRGPGRQVANHRFDGHGFIHR